MQGSGFLPAAHEQLSFLAFAFRYIFDTGPDDSRGIKVAILVNDKFPDGEKFYHGTALSSHRFLIKHKLDDWKQWQNLGANDQKVEDTMSQYEVEEWLQAQKGKKWWKDRDDEDEALNLMLFARHWVFNSQIKGNFKEEYERMAELVNDLSPISHYTPEIAEMKLNSPQSAIEHPKPDWSTISSGSQEVRDFRRNYRIDEWVEKKGYK